MCQCVMLPFLLRHNFCGDKYNIRICVCQAFFYILLKEYFWGIGLEISFFLDSKSYCIASFMLYKLFDIFGVQASFRCWLVKPK